MSTRTALTCKPWLWIEKAALEKIRSSCEDVKGVLLVYMALCEIASDERKEHFMASMAKIGGKCDLSRPTVLKHLNQLEFIGLVEIDRSLTNEHMRIPSAYRMLCCESEAKDRAKSENTEE